MKPDLLKVVLAFVLFASFFTFCLFRSPVTGIVFFALCLIASAWWLVSVWGRLKQASASKNWPEVDFTLRSSKVVALAPGIAFTGPERFVACYQLQYEWNDEQFECTENTLRNVPQPYRSSEESAEKLISSIEEKGRLIVSPDNPNVVFLYADEARSHFLPFFAAAALTLISGTFLISFLIAL